jgi:hypothetical protein
MHYRLLSHQIILSRYSIQVYKILQHLSTLLGAVAILYAIAQLPPGQSTKSNNIINYWIKLLGIGLLVLVIRILTGLKLHEYGDVIVTAISGMLIGLIITSAISPAKQTA